MNKRNRTRAILHRAIETLEARQLLSVDFTAGVLTVDGTAADNAIVFSEDAGTVHVTVDGVEDNLAGYAGVTSVVVAGLAGADTIDLGSLSIGANVDGGEGNDTITSGIGNDTLTGDGGDDTFKFNDGWGSDVINEGIDGGNDTMDFSACTTNLLAIIGALNVSSGNNYANHAGNNIENLIGGSGNDTFYFQSGEGVTGTIDGGPGNNTLDYLEYTDAVTVNLGTGAATGTGGISGFSTVVGGSGNDSLTGDGSDNNLDGGAGNDSLNGGGGSDTFTFSNGTGQDTITQPPGSHAAFDFSEETAALVFTINSSGVSVSKLGTVIASGGTVVNRLVGGKANDVFLLAKGATFAGTISGGGGRNALDYRNYITAVKVDLRTGAATGTQGVANIADLVGGAANDVLVGTDAANRLWGMGGRDKLYGLAGNDRLDGGDGNDYIYGGDGNDAIAGGNGADKLYGENGNDKLYGGAGNDTLVGGYGADYMSGDNDNDLLYGRDKTRDSLYGGNGTDLAQFDSKLDRLVKLEGILR